MIKTTTLLALAAASLGIAACGATSSASTTSHPTAAKAATSGPVSVTLTEWAVKTSTSTAPAGKVTFDVRNAGKAPHEFVVLRTSKSAADLGHGTRIPETGHVGEVGDLKAGATGTLTVKLAPGHYSLVCNLPSHYGLGMHTDFTVR